jgi:hypothetical protein
LWPNRENLSWWEFFLTVLITLIIAAELGLAIYALEESKLQGEVLRDLKDNEERAARLNERPWMNVAVGQGQLVDGQPLVMPIQITNSGKTPAKNVQGTIVLNLLHKGEEPGFIYETGHPRYAIDVGMMAPNFPNRLSWAVLPKNLPPSAPLKPISVSSVIRQGINDGSLYIAAHGRITYDDIFGKSHWMTFCSYAQNPPITGPDAAKCSQHNDVDKNDWRGSDAPGRADGFHHVLYQDVPLGMSMVSFLDRHSGLISAVGLVLAAIGLLFTTFGLLLTLRYLRLYRGEIRNQAKEQERLAWERILKILHQIAKWSAMANQSSVQHSRFAVNGVLPQDLADRYGPASETLLGYWLQLKTELGIMPDCRLIEEIQSFVDEFDTSTDARASEAFATALYPISRSVSVRAQRSFGGSDSSPITAGGANST